MLTELVNSQRVNPRSCSCDDSLLKHYTSPCKVATVASGSRRQLELCGARLDIGRGQASRPQPLALSLQQVSVPCILYMSSCQTWRAGRRGRPSCTTMGVKLWQPESRQRFPEGQRQNQCNMKADGANGVYKKRFREVKVNGHCDLPSQDHREVTRYKHTLLYSC